MSPIQSRGPVGQAAEKLKVALTAKLDHDKANPLNTGLVQAIDHVRRFLQAGLEDSSAFEQLKADVRKTLMQPSTLAASPMRRAQTHMGTRASMPAPPQPPQQLRASTAAGRLPVRSSAAPLVASPREGPASSSPPEHSEVELYWGRQKASSSSLDWSMPQRLLNSKAFITSASLLDHMVLAQDELAVSAEVWERQMRRREQAQVRATYDAQVAELGAARRAEALQRRADGEAADAALVALKREEEEAKRRQAQAQEATRAMYREQVEELRERRSLEALQRRRQAAYEALQARQAAQQEKERKERAAAENRRKLRSIQDSLMAAMTDKARARVAQQQEERRAAEEYKKTMDAREAARLKEAAAREEKMRAAFERAGGSAMQANLEEAARQDAERAARKQAEFDAQVQEQVARETARRKEETRQRLEALDAQLAHKEAERRRAAREMRALKDSIDAAAAAEKLADKQRKAQERQRKSAELAALKEAMMEEHKRRFFEYTHRVPESDMWVHSRVLGEGRPGFTNIAVPPHLTGRTITV